MLKLFYSNNLTSLALRKLAESLTKQYENAGIKHVVTFDALEKDWDRHSQWEPLVWAVFDAKGDAEKSLRVLQFAREKSLSLMDGADNDNAKVGAIRSLVETVKAEIQLSQSLGTLPRVNMEPSVKVDVNVSSQTAVSIQSTTKLLAEYDDILKSEMAKEKADLPKHDSTE